MLQKLQKRKENGFTIIEVLIVLAIAGLIMLVVFLAVPALQRNSRNTTRKNDVSSLLGAYSEYVNNNGGAVPATCDGDDTTCFVKDAKLSHYDNTTATGVTFTKNTAAASPAAVTNLDQVRIYSYTKCAASGGGTTTTNASSRNIVALYAVESSGNPVSQCQES